MRIGDVLKTKGTEVATVSASVTVAELLNLLAEHNVGALVVSEDGITVAGIVSERDIVRRLHSDGSALLARSVGEIMTAEVRSCDPDDTVGGLMRVMTEHRIRHVPVVVAGRLTGLVSIGDVVKSRLGELEEERQHLESYIAGS
jgi:CBS domain-containing protein